MKDSFIFYRSFYESLKSLPDDSRLRLYDNICEMALNENDIDGLKGFEVNIFTLIRPQILANNQRYENGKKGGRPKKKTNGSDNKKTIGFESEKPNVNVNVNENENVNVNNNKKKSIKEKYGTYGRVKLTIEEYLRLVNEFGEDFIKQQIELLDEYIESNNNKNKYTNFNLVLRKSIKDNWFKGKEKTTKDLKMDLGDFIKKGERK